jgi:hypothetical protein
MFAVELKEQPFAPTLAHKLSDVPHVSRLLRHIAQLGGAGERHVPRTVALPHWPRLVSHSGMTRDGSTRTDWLCRHE